MVFGDSSGLYPPAAMKDQYLIVPVARKNENFPKTDLREYEHAGCWHKSVRFFRKYDREQLIGSYMIETEVEQSQHTTWMDDLEGAKVTHHIFRIKKLDEDSGANSPQYVFEEAGSAPASVVSCELQKLKSDFEKLVKKF